MRLALGRENAALSAARAMPDGAAKVAAYHAILLFAAVRRDTVELSSGPLSPVLSLKWLDPFTDVRHPGDFAPGKHLHYYSPGHTVGARASGVRASILLNHAEIAAAR